MLTKLYWWQFYSIMMGTLMKSFKCSFKSQLLFLSQNFDVIDFPVNLIRGNCKQKKLAQILKLLQTMSGKKAAIIKADLFANIFESLV